MPILTWVTRQKLLNAPIIAFPFVCYLLKALRSFIDEASLSSPRCGEDVIGRGGLERIEACKGIGAGKSDILGQLLAASATAVGVEEEELEAGHEMVVPKALPGPLAGTYE
jgi:hypothetical protein